MTPKEKAIELVNSYTELAENIEWISNEETREKAITFNDELGDEVITYWHKLTIQSALIAVNEIISIKLLWFQKDTKDIDFWKEVKEELLKIK